MPGCGSGSRRYVRQFYIWGEKFFKFRGVNFIRIIRYRSLTILFGDLLLRGKKMKAYRFSGKVGKMKTAG